MLINLLLWSYSFNRSYFCNSMYMYKSSLALGSAIEKVLTVFKEGVLFK